MARRSATNDAGKLDGIATGTSADYNVIIEPTETVTIRSLFPAVLKLRGSVTGKAYVWEQAGAETKVDLLDAEGLLSKHLTERPCCGGRLTVLFEKVEE